MKRYLKIKGETRYNQYDSESWSLDIEIQLEDLVSVLLELQLLEFGHTESCTLNSKDNTITVAFSHVKEKNQSIIERNGPRFQVGLTKNDIEFISSYLLQYYRDSLAPVDHVDIEVEGLNELARNGTLVIKTSNAIEPMSGDEARKILGLD